jgi:hypothetical protein
MEFLEVEGVVEVLEIPVDALGRAEIKNGRVRMTYVRTVTAPDGTERHIAAVAVTWSTQALRQSRQAFARLREVLETIEPGWNTPAPERIARSH